ncbi:8459_t:CDS:1, partial [Ambispora leptoticha]
MLTKPSVSPEELLLLSLTLDLDPQKHDTKMQYRRMLPANNPPSNTNIMDATSWMQNKVVP